MSKNPVVWSSEILKMIYRWCLLHIDVSLQAGMQILMTENIHIRSGKLT
jgi:hypothetical protein